MDKTPGTVTPNVQLPRNLSPREMRMERQGDVNVPMSRRFPEIRGGQCEFCGVIDPHQPAHLQYKLCPHYRGMEARCAYCPAEKDQVEVVRQSTLMVHEHPFQPGTLVMWCNATQCADKHIKRFEISR